MEASFLAAALITAVEHQLPANAPLLRLRANVAHFPVKRVGLGDVAPLDEEVERAANGKPREPLGQGTEALTPVPRSGDLAVYEEVVSDVDNQGFHPD